MTPIAPILLSMLICGFAGVTEVLFPGEKKQNNLVSELLESASISKTGNPLTFTRSSDGWIFISANYKGYVVENRTLPETRPGRETNFPYRRGSWRPTTHENGLRFM